VTAQPLSAGVLDEFQTGQPREQLGDLTLVSHTGAVGNLTVAGAWALADDDEHAHRAVGQTHAQARHRITVLNAL
jgi:hypothetical protein